ncbi:hypothetical protein AXF42_Ash012241 [Apostasia shenzhenica]|uniref:Uncharacterized protein n=1 Tax=Apostasia shenzhenica TaxID=1088818 RepID=A0A2I0B4E4_9ASPA|nr:hypothetical protein AXF42_Ash012241 [Apostasia shenzhenica]
MYPTLLVPSELVNELSSLSPPLHHSRALVKRLDLYGKLYGHKGCVNSVHFCPNGAILVSGSDDKDIIFWNWETKSKMLAYSSGHSDNVFEAQIMPYTEDRVVVTSAADGQLAVPSIYTMGVQSFFKLLTDCHFQSAALNLLKLVWMFSISPPLLHTSSYRGFWLQGIFPFTFPYQVRLGQMREDGKVDTKLLGMHHGRIHKLAIEPGSPHNFYSCGEDGLVQHFDLRTETAVKLFTCFSFSDSKQPILLNTIVIDPRNPHYFSTGGFDEYARVYDIRNYQRDASNGFDQPVNTFCPLHLIGCSNVHITGLAYSRTSELLVSYNDELIYMFEKNMGVGPNPRTIQAEGFHNLDKPQVYEGHRNSETVKGVSFFGPCDEYVVSGSDCGHIYIWKKTGGELMRMMVGDKHIVNCMEPHPFFPFLATSGFDENVKLWAPAARKLHSIPKNAKQIMTANKRGREARARITLSPDVIMHVLRLQRRQTLLYTEPLSADADSDSDSTPEDGSAASPRDCNIS